MIIFYVIVFTVITAKKAFMIIRIIFYFKMRACDRYCEVLVYYGFCNILILTLLMISVQLWFFYIARKYQNYLYKKHKVALCCNFVIIMTGMISLLFYATLYVLSELTESHKWGHEYHGSTGRLLHYISMIGPPTAINLFMKPFDHFATFNMYPEQLRKVSIVQHEISEYSRRLEWSMTASKHLHLL